MIKVVHCLEAVHCGGVEQRRLSLARKLPADQFQQTLICAEARGDLPAQFRAAGCEVHEIGKFRRRIDWQAISRARAIIRDFAPHIVHGAVFEGVVTAAIAGRWARAPFVIGEETSDAYGRRWTGHLFLRALSTLCDRMVGVSPVVRDYLLERAKIPAKKVILIDNGVAEPDPPNSWLVKRLREQLTLPPDAIVAGTVGRLLDSHKRVSDAVRALSIASVPELHLLVVGTGPDEAMLRALATELGVHDRVHFAGYQGDTRPFYELMDIFLQPSAHEAFGLTIVEAMLAGLPVIGTNVGGIPGIILDGKTGILVDPRASEQLANALKLLCQCPAVRPKMGMAGLDRARRCFGADRYVMEVAELYTSLAEQLPIRPTGA
jgi:glycosyltransferase involved in cell wall biosynthesis